jgi:hypothetical protein
MNTTSPTRLHAFSWQKHLPLLILLNPGKLTWKVILSFAIGTLIGWSGYIWLNFPLWTITVFVLLALTPVGIIKWREDLRLHGRTVMLLSIILIAQGVHTIEHVTQWTQYYILFLPARQSNGLISAANAEWVHFVWNWLVLIFVIALIRGGIHNPWMFLLLGVATAHAFEHSYTFIRHLMVLSELRQLGVFDVTAQGLPGVVGRDGWLARSEATRGTFVSILPGLTTAMRLDVHFWWNLLEMILLLAAGNVFLIHHFKQHNERKNNAVSSNAAVE